MRDLIYRDDAIKALGDEPTVWTDRDDYALGERNQWAIDRLAIETVPVAKPVEGPVRIKGKWYKPTGMMPPEFTGVYRCSECDEIALFDWKHHRQMLTSYCPCCGADMREERT